MLALVTLEGLYRLHVDHLELRTWPFACLYVHEQAMPAAETKDISLAHVEYECKQVADSAGAESLGSRLDFKPTVKPVKRFCGSDGGSPN